MAWDVIGFSPKCLLREEDVERIGIHRKERGDQGSKGEEMESNDEKEQRAEAKGSFRRGPSLSPGTL